MNFSNKIQKRIQEIFRFTKCKPNFEKRLNFHQDLDKCLEENNVLN